MNIQEFENKTIIHIDRNQLLGIENEAFLNVVKDSIEKGSKNISIDLSDVKFISSMGIEGFLHAYNICKSKNVDFNLQNVNSTVKNVFSTLKLIDILKII